MGGSRCGKIGSWGGWTRGRFVVVVRRGGGDGTFADVDVTKGNFVGFLVITEIGLLGVVAVGRLVVVLTAAAGGSLLTDWNVVNSSISTDDVVSSGISSFLWSAVCIVVAREDAAASNGTLAMVVGLLDGDGRCEVVLSSFWTRTMDGSLVESVAKTVVPVLIIGLVFAVLDADGRLLPWFLSVVRTPDETLIISKLVLIGRDAVVVLWLVVVGTVDVAM